MIFEIIDYNSLFAQLPIERTLIAIRIDDSLENLLQINRHYPIKTNSIKDFLEIYSCGLNSEFRNISNTSFFFITHLGYINLVNESYSDYFFFPSLGLYDSETLLSYILNTEIPLDLQIIETKKKKINFEGTPMIFVEEGKRYYGGEGRSAVKFRKKLQEIREATCCVFTEGQQILIIIGLMVLVELYLNISC